MLQLSWYIAKSVIGAVAMVLLVILALDVISALVDQLGDMRGDYNFTEVLIYVGLTIPRRIIEYIPFSSLVGCLIGLGILASSSELVVMRAAGVTVARITIAVLKPVLLFIVLGLLLGEYVTPYTEQAAESRRSVALGRGLALDDKGMWNRDGNEYVHANTVLPGGVLMGVTRYQFDSEGQMLSSSFADRATFQGDHWLEEKANVSSFAANGSHLVQKYFQTRKWETELTPALLSLLVLSPDGLSINDLYRYTEYLSQQGLDASQYRLAFWQKVLQPLATASLVLIAVSFIFGPLRETTMGYRIFTGVLVGIIFRTSQDLLGPSSLVFGFAPVIAVAIPIVICAVIGLLLLRKAN
ncbi:LPS export ABC transporter permease LptG [Pseudoteredinibacter isoporae]|uniref:Lipopolysaccharide export system permease protein n=1 Tax=Pseudoteredinibacter isoporae TaxID=570281 RepID=A0A7X0JUZ3_9GAMM|nr:LPS export ABC transporter permease LptG [Pseudoteredinibacter isoporae]MBB6522299.1 lipopolysaccharide export system permease protein [Pseudoteredinibacter isoporae]NHO87832.1 LPS export ABC transporter permease LptG [Pseudoteredinibacter isoporae]NIB23837.1 LPS export ABC transporter permease LptG [Pseudoteredinibacter isoporae]